MTQLYVFFGTLLAQKKEPENALGSQNTQNDPP